MSSGQRELARRGLDVCGGRDCIPAEEIVLAGDLASGSNDVAFDEVEI